MTSPSDKEDKPNLPIPFRSAYQALFAVGERTGIYVSVLANAASLILILVASAYVSGFVILNSFLSNYGMISYDFLQPRYLSAGLLYMASTFGPLGLIWFVHHKICIQYYPNDPDEAEINTAWAIALVFTSITVALPWLFPRPESIPSYKMCLAFILFISMCTLTFLPQILPKKPKNWSSKLLTFWKEGLVHTRMLKMNVFWLGVAYTVVLGGLEYRYLMWFTWGMIFLIAGTTSGQTPSSGVVRNVWGLVLGFGLTAWSVHLYGKNTFPLISPSIGGGTPVQVSIVLKKDAQMQIGRLMGREDWQCVMQNISLLHENDDFLFILPNGYYKEETAVAISKAEVASFQYQREKLTEVKKCIM